MFTNLLTAKVVNKSEIATPPTTIATIITAAAEGAVSVPNSGIASPRRQQTTANSAAAHTPASTPCHKALAKNGRIMNHLVAPTSF